MIQIQSGRTQEVTKALEKWYGDEKTYADWEWKWGFNKESLQEIVSNREGIAFRSFFVRYLLAIHADVFQPLLFSNLEEGQWLNQSAETMLQLMEETEAMDYAHSPDIIKILTDTVFDDFISNGFYINDEKEDRIRIRGSVNRGIPSKGKKEVRPYLWDKDDLLRKIKARKVSSDFISNSDYINADELFAFGFGLNMAYEDLSFLMKKALRRADFNLWDWKEFLLYVTFRYAKGDLFAFYTKSKEAYANKENRPLEYEWGDPKKFSTIVIEKETDAIVNMIKEEYYSLSLDENGELPSEMVEYICKYKFLTENVKDYTRTAIEESRKLLSKFLKNIQKLEGIELEDSKDKEREKKSEKKNEKRKQDIYGTAHIHAQGKVLVYYDPQLGLNIPKGTKFYKFDKKTGRRISFESQTDVKIEPREEMAKEIQIEVRSIKAETKMTVPEMQTAFVQAKAKFKSDNPYLSEITNKSKFKPSMKADEGSEIFVAGKLFAKCEAGKTISAGTRFYTQNSQGVEVEFISLKTVKTDCFEELWVCCCEGGEEATKNQITECSIPGWRQKIIRIENSKIGFSKKPEAQGKKGGKIYNYLYIKGGDASYLEDILEEKYFDSLEMILEGAQLSSTKLNQIIRGKEKHITRNDLLTLSFLAYVSGQENERIEKSNTASEDYDQRMADFLNKTNELLRKCGYYELYAPNPYDALLMCLLSSNEAINSYKNLWSWYLFQKDKRR